MTRYVGLDVHKHFIVACGLTPDGKVANSKKSYPEAQPRNGDEGQDLAKVQHRAWFGGS